MKKIKTITLLFAVVLALGACCNTEKKECCVKQEKSLPAEIVEVIENYANGSRKGDVSFTKKAFAEGATMSWNEDDTLHCEPIKALYDYVEATGAEEVEFTVENFSVEGNVAVVYIASRFGETCYHDMFSLVRSENGWKIVSKVYSIK